MLIRSLCQVEYDFVASARGMGRAALGLGCTGMLLPELTGESHSSRVESRRGGAVLYLPMPNYTYYIPMA